MYNFSKSFQDEYQAKLEKLKKRQMIDNMIKAVDSIGKKLEKINSTFQLPNNLCSD